MTTRERIEIAKRRIRGMQEPEEKREIKKRNPYRRGIKDFLSSMEIGESKEWDGYLSWRNMQSCAATMQKEYGCMFTFRTINGIRTIFRFR